MHLTTAPSVTPTACPPAGTSHRVTRRSVVRAEWIKLRSVRSNVTGLLAAGAVMVLLGMLFASLAGSDQPAGPATRNGSDALSTSLAGINLSQLVIGVLAAVFVAGEYATGMIRTMFGAVPGRVPVLRAKAIVFGGTTWLVMTVASFVAFLAGQAVYGGSDPTFTLSDPGVLRAVLGAGVYAGGIALIGVALGFLLRSTATTIGVLVGTLMIAPVLVGLLPDSFGDPIAKVLPSNLGTSMMSATTPDGLFSAGAAVAGLAVWVIGLTVAAAVTLHRRDA